MSKRSVFCIIPSRGRADSIVVRLRDGGFPTTEVSVLFSAPEASGELVAADTVSAPSSGAIRGVFAWVEGIRRIAIPDNDPLIAGGPIAAHVTPGMAGGVEAVLIAFNLPTMEAQKFAARIKAGHFLISVQTENPEMADRAREIFTAAQAEEIFSKMDVITPKLFSREIRGVPSGT